MLKIPHGQKISSQIIKKLKQLDNEAIKKEASPLSCSESIAVELRDSNNESFQMKNRSFAENLPPNPNYQKVISQPQKKIYS